MTKAESPVRAYAKETPQYDANGNLTRQRDNAKDLTKRISVDSQDRIVQIQDANNAILGSYWYDEGGFRVRRSALEQKNNQFTNVEILYPSKFYGLEYIESENVITSVNNVYLNGVRIAALNEAGALAYFLTDQVDSVSHVLDDEGNTLSRMQYLPYGDTFVHKGDTNFAPKYNSQELDRESGFYFYNARYYDPGIARFTSADTIIDGEFDTQGWNRFSYVKGNPIGAKDPTGHEANGGIGIMMNSQCKGSANCNSAGLSAVSEGAKKAVVGTAVATGAAVTGYAAAAELGAAALPSAIYLSSRFGSNPGLTNSLLKVQDKLRGSLPNAINATKEGLKNANGISNKGNNTGNGSGKSDVGSTRSSNKLAPYKDNPNDKIKASEVGDHTSFKRDKDGNIYKYETYEKTKTGHFDPKVRGDAGQWDGSPGKAHTNSSTGKKITTPHIQGKEIPNGVRKPLPGETPNNSRWK
ncbi:RHS repeat-associated core domain-containing protein [Leptospira sanjuanensis]|uniref:RHS repeat-associated core domain-containing protein n=1 Tax=Leptospira sanjuanensis TaxID=2879643 RepID=UPI001EE7F9B1|nr:RHS repeat-associated core domain-containing protein [Leptospira sanjuanensis]